MSALHPDQPPPGPAAAARSYAEAALMVAGSTLVGLAIAPRWGSSAVDLLYLPAVIGAALLGGFRPALLSAAASALAYNYFFTAPAHSFRIDSPADLVTVVALFTVAAVASRLAASVRRQAQIASAHAARNATIAGLARRLLSCRSDSEIAQTACEELAALFQCNAMLVTQAAAPEPIASAPGLLTLAPGDVGAAALTLATGEPAGRALSRANTSEWRFEAVRSEAEILAAIGLARDDGAPAIDPSRLPLFRNLLDQVALALGRARVEAEARQFAETRARDRVRSALLSTIGHDLTPPVDRILRIVAALKREGSGEREALSALAADAAALQRYIVNLADLGLEDDRPLVEGQGVSIDLFNRTVRRDGHDVHLPPKEYALLAELARHPGRVLSHAHLLRTVWGPAHEGQIDYLRVAVRGLRQKLESDPARPRLVVNEPAVGYRLVVE